MLKNIKNKLTQYNYLYRESDQKDKNGKQQLQAKAALFFIMSLSSSIHL